MDPVDSIFSQPQERVAPFIFDAKVAEVFEDMIQRSVPGYGLSLQLIAALAASLPADVERVYDLGCSLGAGMVAADRGLVAAGAEIVGVDCSFAMLERAGKYLQAAGMRHPFSLLEADVCEVPLLPHALCLLNFTLQFIPVERRLPVLTRIADAQLPGGLLILSEKITYPDPEEEALQIHWHHAFKRLNGYSELEISQKRTALENRLIPETEAAHCARLREAGFSRVFTWFQAFNFTSFVAIK